MADPKPLTAPQAKALTIIHAARHGGINPAWLGEKMWPETTGSGSSGSRGHIPDTGRNLSAGAFLSRLRKAGLLYQDSPNGVTKMYTLSPAGRKALATHTGQEVRLAVLDLSTANR